MKENSKPSQIKCENERPDQSHHQSNCSVIFVCLFCLLFLQGFCWRKRFCWRVKALGHSILVTKAKGTFVQVWARNVLHDLLCTFSFCLSQNRLTSVFVYYWYVADVGHQVGSCVCLQAWGFSRFGYSGFPLSLKTNYFKFQPRSKMVDKELLFRGYALRNTVNGLINTWGVY